MDRDQLIAALTAYLGAVAANKLIDEHYITVGNSLQPKPHEGTYTTQSQIVVKSCGVVRTEITESGQYRIHMVASDTEKDSASDHATLTLYNDFVRRADLTNNPPFLSLSHKPKPVSVSARLRDKIGRHGVPGFMTDIGIDEIRGLLLLSGYIYQDNDLGRTVYRALEDDRDNPDYDTRIRASIGFYDYGHTHDDFLFIRRSEDQQCPLCRMGVLGRGFTYGELDHVALTRAPMNKRTYVIAYDKGEIEMARAQPTTHQEDVESIVGAELAAAVEEAVQGVERTQLDVVIRGNEAAAPPVPAEAPAPVEAVVAASTPAPTAAPVQQRDALTEAFSTFAARVQAAQTVADVDAATNDLANVARSVVTARNPESAIPQLIQAEVQRAVAPLVETINSLVQSLAVINRAAPTTAMGDQQPRTPTIVHNVGQPQSGQLPPTNTQTPMQPNTQRTSTFTSWAEQSALNNFR